MEEAVNHLTNSQSTAKTMADGARIAPSYCTLPRPPGRVMPAATESTGQPQASDRAHYYTLRPAAAMGAVGGRNQKPRHPQPEDERIESNRSLLYEQNMSTFENFCERRHSEQRLHHPERHTEDEYPSDDGGQEEALGNFCTLRKVRRTHHRGGEGGSTHLPHTGAYCTLKKKKLQLNRKFVESFLEDPNAKVVDYLSELDAYLDEMDGMDDDDAYDSVAGSESDSVGGSEDRTPSPSGAFVDESVSKKAHEDAVVPGERRLQYYQTNARNLGQPGNELYQEDRIRFGDIKHFCTLPKQKRTQFLNAFKRGASVRRTFVGEPNAVDGDGERPPTGAQIVPETRIQCDAQASTATLPRHGQSWSDGTPHHHHPSWHRNSMRKKHLIELPEQEIIVHPPSPGATTTTTPSVEASNESLVESTELSSISTLPMDELPMAKELAGTMPALVVALPPSPEPPTVERIEREPILASAPPASASSSPPPPLETDLDGIDVASAMLVQERPRQAGRRAQSQPRIGSITVVRDTATNELIIRTNSVPGQAPTAPPLEDLGSSNQHNHRAPHQHQHQHHRHSHHHDHYGGESEGSSMGSSRNPSPVSLLSTTTTCSSIASAADNANDRTHRLADPMHDGAVEEGSSGYQRNADGTVSRRYRDSSDLQRRQNTSTTSSTTVQTESVPTPGTVTAPLDDATTGGRIDEAESEADASSSPQRSSRRSDGRPKARWPHAISRSLATTFCTLGLFNISRFAVFSVHFGANFVVQFLIFSLLFGIPMLWLQMVLGARIRGGPVTMWRISPICKGIGIALLFAQALVTLYSTISLAWVLVYFRDAFIMRNEKYRWQEPFEVYRGAGYDNQSFRLPDTVADYFNGVVLQRYHLAHQVAGGSVPTGGYGGRNLYPSVTGPRTSGIGAIRFQHAFNMAILWTLVFVALCRGIRSLGKAVIGVFLGAFLCLTAVCAKFLTFINYDSVQNIFPSTDWQDFFLNSRSWTSAAQETFLTWGLLGVSIYAINCRSNRKGSCNARTRRELRRDAFLVAFVTLAVLLLAAVLGSACVQILNGRGYYYMPGSYENLGTNVFLRPANQPLPPQHATMPNRWYIRYSTVIGESFKRSYTDPNRESGYQPLRLATELLPAALAAASPEHIAPIWGLIAYLALVLFGLGQLCVMWKPVAGAIGDAPSSILLSCVTGLLLGMPLATEGGINIVHYLDTILGAAWWVLLLWIGHILALFLVRGRPFTSDILVNDLQVLQSFSAFVAFAWNFLLPIGLIFMCIIQYRLSNSAVLFNWSSTTTSAAAATAASSSGSSTYWPLWARQVGGFVQVGFLLLVPVVMVIQIYRYLCRGPPDILDRVDLLLRPPIDGDTSTSLRAVHARRAAISVPLQQGTSGAGSTTHDGTDPVVTLSMDARSTRDTEDAPPKYTPPPSYTTATGARIAKLLRNSIRRSVRRLMGETSGGSPSIRHRTALPQTAGQTPDQSANPSACVELPPPDYCSALQQYGGGTGTLELNPVVPRVLYNSATLGSSGRRYRSLNATGETQPHQQHTTSQQHSFTASDVRQILRPGGATANNTTPSTGSGFTQTLRNTLLRRGHSMENLVLAAAPLGDSSIITLTGDEDHDDNEGREGGRNVHAANGMAGTGRDSVI